MRQVRVALLSKKKVVIVAEAKRTTGHLCHAHRHGVYPGRTPAFHDDCRACLAKLERELDELESSNPAVKRAAAALDLALTTIKAMDPMCPQCGGEVSADHTIGCLGGESGVGCGWRPARPNWKLAEP